MVRVQSSIYGGAQYSAADQEYYAMIVRTLTDRASRLTALATRWTNAQISVTAHQSSLQWCALNAGISANVSTQEYAVSVPHVRMDLLSLAQQCGTIAAHCQSTAQTLQSLADRVARARSLYADAELTSRRIATEAIELFTTHFPGAALGATLLFAEGGLIYGVVHEGKLNWIHALNATTFLQEGLMSGIGSRVAHYSPIGSLLATGEVNDGATIIAHASATVKDHMQGNHLDVQEVTPSYNVVQSCAGVEQALAGLHALGTARLRGEDDAGLEYGTIAVSQYVREDGSSAWLVTVPGTDGQPDSPFGWEQNVELMAADSAIRRQADSARMVAEAMHMAGIGTHDPVAIVGHSQGGIVAAVLASDFQDEFAISHIVTAGSPVANHPISEHTWVTSVEMEDELVAALDGAANPVNEHWLTIRGSLSPNEGAVVNTTSDTYEITHWLEYHQAAYRDALDLGSQAVHMHDQHFQSVIAGEYAGTTYWQGRMRQQDDE